MTLRAYSGSIHSKMDYARTMIRFFIPILALFVAVQPAQADEIYVGIAAHQVLTPLAADTGSEGVDLQAGYRAGRIAALSFIGKPSPYIMASINIDGGTSFAAAGLNWKFGDKFYLRPGIGLAVHDGPKLRFAPDGSQTQLGSRVLFVPELAIGIRLSKRVDLEASWVHLSHARIFSSVQNPGLDSIGMRLVVKLP